MCYVDCLFEAVFTNNIVYVCGFSERPRYTAARECFEETLGILGETDHLASLLDNRTENNVFEVSTM